MSFRLDDKVGVMFGDIEMFEYEKNQCKACKDLWQFSTFERSAELTTNFERQSRLYRCSICKSFWEETERYGIVISETEVKYHYGSKYLAMDK